MRRKTSIAFLEVAIRVGRTRCAACTGRCVVRVDHRFTEWMDARCKLSVTAVKLAEMRETVRAGIAVKTSTFAISTDSGRGTRSSPMRPTGNTRSTAVRRSHKDEADVS